MAAGETISALVRLRHRLLWTSVCFAAAVCALRARLARDSQMTETVWEQVDEPVLRWVLARPRPEQGVIAWKFEREGGKTPELPGLADRAIHESLARLHDAGFVDGNLSTTSGHWHWTSLRVTAQGLIILGEWPDLDRVAQAASIHRLLRALSDDAPPDEQDALRRAAGVVSRTAGDVVLDTATEIARSLGEEAAAS